MKHTSIVAGVEVPGRTLHLHRGRYHPPHAIREAGHLQEGSHITMDISHTIQGNHLAQDFIVRCTPGMSLQGCSTSEHLRRLPVHAELMPGLPCM